jgi:agmatinase
MNFPNYFADAESNFDEADYVIFGVPYDKTSSFRKGASLAPKEIRNASWNFETYNIRTGFDIKNVKIHDYGDLKVTNDKPKEMVNKVKELASKIISNNKFPIAIGGEHSTTVGIVKAFQRDISVVSLDAHIDFREIYENEPYNHACVIRRIADHIDIKNIAVLGIRSAEKEEFDDAKNLGLFYIDSVDIKDRGIKKAIDETKNYLKNKKNLLIYLNALKVFLQILLDLILLKFAPLMIMVKQRSL